MKEAKTVNRIALLTTLLATLWVTGCHAETHEAEAPVKFAVTSPLRKSTDLPKEYVARIRAIQHVELRALERGYLQDTYVDEGQHVSRGQRMFQIQPLIQQAEAKKAQAELDRTRVEYNNAKMLADKNVVSPNELALAKANFDRASAELALANTHKNFTLIKAPFDGIMGQLEVRRGALLSEGDMLTTMADNSKMWVYFNVSEAEYLNIKSRQAKHRPTDVRLMMANGQIFDHIGKVETVMSDFNNESGTIPFRATFPNPERLLRHGETGKVVMNIPIENALLIPKKATFDVLDKKFVYVVDDKNVVKSRPITVGAETSELFVVDSGLSDKDRFIYDGLRKVKEGGEIAPEYKAPAEVAAHLDVPVE
jgi:membrane fusion protein (multidrug efflux system)